MNVFGFIELVLCRLIYGYLVVFAETQKPDLGGAFWVTNLRNVQRCVPVYIFLMSGVLCFRDRTWGPCIISAASYIYWNISWTCRPRKCTSACAPRTSNLSFARDDRTIFGQADGSICTVQYPWLYFITPHLDGEPNSRREMMFDPMDSAF